MLKINQTVIAKHDNQDVIEYELLTDYGFSVKVLNYGGIITAINTPDKLGVLANVVVHHDRFMPDNPGHFGAITGRCAGRIANARFDLNGQTYSLEANNKQHNLHSGKNALDKQFWQVSILDDGLLLQYHSVAGESGFPADVMLNVLYVIQDKFELSILIDATASSDTILSLTNHTYFDLSSNSNCKQELMLHSSKIALLDETLVPNGELLDITNTPFDFRALKPIARDINEPHKQLQIANGYDHPFILDNTNEYIAIVQDPESGRKLQVYTTEPVCVIYTANHFPTQASAICLETQRMPNAINIPQYADQVIHGAKKPYKNHTIWKFS